MVFSSRDSWSLEGVPRPWVPGEGVFDWLRERIDPATGGLRPNQGELPDDDDGEPGGELRLRQLSVALRELCAEPLAARLAHVYRVASLGPVDDLLEALVDGLASDPARLEYRLAAIGLALAGEAPSPHAITLGLGILRAFADDPDEVLPVLSVLALHPRFTEAAALVAVEVAPLGDRVVWGMARRVEGRERLALLPMLEDSPDPEIQGWLEGERAAAEIEDAPTEVR